MTEPDPTLNVSALARLVIDSQEAARLDEAARLEAHPALPSRRRAAVILLAWGELTGLDDLAALGFARRMAVTSPDMTAAITPF